MQTTLGSLLDALAAERPGAPAFVDPKRRVTFGQLADESRRLATSLAGLGIGRGDRVAIWLPNVPAWVVAFFACARLGAVAVAVNTRFKSGEIADIVGRCGARALVFWPGFRQIDFAGILEQVSAVALERVQCFIAYGEDEPAPPVQLQGKPVLDYHALTRAAPLSGDQGGADGACVIFTTSGTTKAPKFVAHGHAGLLAHARDIGREFGLDGDDTVILLAMPLCAAGGFSQLMAALCAGRPLVTMPAFDAAQAAALIQDQRATHTFLVGDMVARLLKAAPGPRPFPSLRRCAFATFTPSEAAVAGEAEARGMPLVGVYGASEVQALYAIQPIGLPVMERTQGGGLPLSRAAAVRVRDPDTGELLAPGVSGELEVLGPSRMLGYEGNPEATAAAFTADGYFRTGDLAFMTGDGRFVYQNRIGDVLRLAGFLVSPVEIEGFLKEPAGVADAQVVSVEIDGALRAVAFVIVEGGAAFNEATLIAHCRRRMANYKVPARIFSVEAFPVTPSANGNKIQKNKLRDSARALIDAR